jgi:DUF2911 family protein
MNRHRLHRLLAFASILALPASPSTLPAQRRSQRAEMMQMVGATEIRAMYIRPVARGRELFGKLVPYGRIWTPSADTAMRLTFSTDVQVEGQALKAGSYSVWAIPDSTTWTVIFNASASSFHLRHRESDDVLRVTAKVDSLPHVETLTLGFPLVDGRKAVMRIQWGTTAVSLAIDTPESDAGQPSFFLAPRLSTR